jgi:hypothetical protein
VQDLLRQRARPHRQLAVLRCGREPAGEIDGERVDVGVDDAAQERDEAVPRVGHLAGFLGDRHEPAEPVQAERRQQGLLAGVAPVERADADARGLGDGADRGGRIRDEDVPGGAEDDTVVARGLGPAAVANFRLRHGRPRLGQR